VALRARGGQRRYAENGLLVAKMADGDSGSERGGSPARAALAWTGLMAVPGGGSWS